MCMSTGWSFTSCSRDEFIDAKYDQYVQLRTQGLYLDLVYSMAYFLTAFTIHPSLALLSYQDGETDVANTVEI